MTFWRTVALIVGKDLRIELRTRETIATMALFALLVVVIFAFAFSIDAERSAMVGPGVLWVTILFAGTLGLTRIFDAERDNGCLEGLFLSPGGPRAVYVAKVIGLLVFMLVAEVLTIPPILALTGLEIAEGGYPLFIGAVLLGTLGFALIGTLFGGMLASARLREVLIPVVVYPVITPILVAGVELTEVAAGGGNLEVVETWLRLMIGFDIIFLVVPPWVFARVMVD